LPDEQRHFVPLRGQEIRQLRPKLAGGKIRQSARSIQRLVSRSRGYKANHGIKLAQSAPKAQKILHNSCAFASIRGSN
jgi:hypothetical protein